MNIGHTCVIPVFILAMAEWNVDGDGESLIISTHIVDWWRPLPALNVCLTATSLFSLRLPSVSFPSPHPPYSIVPACRFGIAEDRATSPYRLYFLFLS
jgi:hypothetical protein